MNSVERVPTALKLGIITALLLAPLAGLHAGDAKPPSPVKTGVILVNHVGFPPQVAKHCVIPDPPEKEFTVHRLKDTKFTQVFAGTLMEGGKELEPGWVGDFTALKEDGIYQVRCGALKSRCFTIHAGVYDVPMRLVFNYFTLARCGDTKRKSITGPCHLDDGNLVGVGHRDFSGGYHQSCDLRKWAVLEVKGLLGVLNFGQLQTPHWDKGTVAEEVRWGCDYYRKLVREDGGMFDSVFIPIHWGPRDYYASDPPAPALWDNVRYQAQAAAYFQKRDAAYADKCRQTAERVWHYMSSDKRPAGRYQPPAMPPLGHQWLKTAFNAYCQDSAADLAYRISAALALRDVTRDESLLEDAARSAAKLLALQVAVEDAPAQASGVFWEGPEGEALSLAPCHPEIGLALCELIRAASKHPDADRWRGSVRAMAERYCGITRRNPWGSVATSFDVREKPVAPGPRGAYPFAYPDGTIRGRVRGAAEKFLAYQYRRGGYHYDNLLAGLFLNRAGEITGNQECLAIAQRQLDWIMGCNPFDASAIEGVGYHQPLRGLFGEFFPPTPQIPGAVIVGLQPMSFDPQQYGNCGPNEYDMPQAGAALWLLAEQATRQ